MATAPWIGLPLLARQACRVGFIPLAFAYFFFVEKKNATGQIINLLSTKIGEEGGLWPSTSTNMLLRIAAFASLAGFLYG